MTPLAAAESVPVIAHAIQLAVAPVFLLTGIASLIGVMATRLARIIDRARSFERDWARLDADARARASRELRSLERRRRWASRAITFCTTAALLVCVMVASLFVEALFGLRLFGFTGVLFIVTMGAVIGGLGCFLCEVWLASATVRIPTLRSD